MEIVWLLIDTFLVCFLFVFLMLVMAMTIRKFSDSKRKERKKIVIYLAGPMHNCNNSQMNNWRQKAKNYFKDYDYVKFLDPVEKEEINMKGAVEGDKEMIKKSTVVIANCWKFSVGTMMEIIYAWENGIPVYVISKKKGIRENWWMIYHSKLVMKEAWRVFSYVRQDYCKGVE